MAAIDDAYKAFAVLDNIFGPEIARRAWALIPGEAIDKPAKQPKKRGPKLGPRDPKKAAILLRLYDEFILAFPQHKIQAPRMNSEFLAAKFKSYFGNSPKAIEKQIRRQLARRRKDQDKMIRQLIRMQVPADTPE